MEPAVSIIIPVYNVQPYLNKCIDSILDQSMKEIEIILVDDGSTDGSAAICDEYARRDDRILVIHKANEGLSCARNDGIAAANSPYIMLVDGDDWVDTFFVERPYNMATLLDADIVWFERDRYTVTGGSEADRFVCHEGGISKEDAFRFNLLHAVAWLGLYRRELFDSIHFPPGRYYEDIGTTYKLIQASNRICFLDSVLYHYRIFRPGSINTEAATCYHHDRKDMMLKRITDMYSWGYGKLLQQPVFTFMICYGNKGRESEVLSLIMKDMCIDPPRDLTGKRKLLLAIYRISPAAFDLVCILSGKRRKYRVRR